MKLACYGAGEIVERAILRPNMALGRPLDVEIFCRSEQRHRALVAKYGIAALRRPSAEILADPDVVAVYIALPNSMHFDAAMAAVEAGKSLLVEKPMVVRPDEALRLEASAHALRTTCTEALMIAHHPWREWLSLRLKEQEAARIAAFTRISFDLPAERRARAPATGQGGGAWYDIAPYWLALMQDLGPVLPQDIRITDVRWSSRGFDLAFRAEADTPFGTFILDAAWDRPFEASHEVRTSAGRAMVRNFLRPVIGDSAIVVDSTWPRTQPTTRIAASNYYTAQFTSFLAQVRSGTFTAAGEAFDRAKAVARVGQHLAATWPSS